MLKFTRDIRAVVPGEVYPRSFVKGDDVPWQLTEQAVAEGWADKAAPQQPADGHDRPQKKAKSSAPENK